MARAELHDVSADSYTAMVFTTFFSSIIDKYFHTSLWTQDAKQLKMLSRVKYSVENSVVLVLAGHLEMGIFVECDIGTFRVPIVYKHVSNGCGQEMKDIPCFFLDVYALPLCKSFNGKQNLMYGISLYFALQEALPEIVESAFEVS